jgi:hypothetical protein
MEKEVVCLSCGKKVEIKLVSYGNGHIGTCPLCKKLAYNSGQKK